MNKENIGNYNIKLNADRPTWIEQFDELDPEKYSLDICGGIKYLLFDEQYHIESEQMTRYFKTVKQITNMSGMERSSNILLDFDPKHQSINLYTIAVHRSNGCTINKLSSSNMQVLHRERALEYNIISGLVTLSIIPDDIQIGDIIEIEYAIIDTNPLCIDYFNGVFNLQFSIPMYQYHLAVIADQGDDIQYKFLDSKENVKIVHFGSKVVYSIEARNIPAIKYEQNTPYWSIKDPYLQIGKRKTWNDIACEKEAYYNNVKIVSPKLVALIENIKTKENTPEGIIIAILTFVSDNIRYFANDTDRNDYQKPADPNITMERLYGDCKAFVLLIKTILSEFSIEAYPLLVNTRRGKTLNQLLPAINLFDHVILCIKLNNKNYFVDPKFTNKVYSLDKLYQHDYGYGLICNNQTTSLIEIKININLEDHITINDEYDIISFADKKFKFKSKIVLEGSPAMHIIKRMEIEPEANILESWRKSYSNYITIQNVISEKIDISNIYDGIIIILVEYDVIMKTYVNQHGYCTYEIIALDLLDYIHFKYPQRSYSDYYYGPELYLDYAITIQDGIKRVKKVITKEISDEAFVLKKIIEYNKKLTFIKYNFKREKEVIPFEKYVSFCDKQNKAANLLSTVLIGRKNKSIKTSRLLQIFIGLAFILPMILNSVLHTSSSKALNNNLKSLVIPQEPNLLKIN